MNRMSIPEDAMAVRAMRASFIYSVMKDVQVQNLHLLADNGADDFGVSGDILAIGRVN